MTIRFARIVLLTVFILLLISACGATPEALPTLPPPTSDTGGNTGGLATAVPESSYPGLEVQPPPATATRDPGYPEQPITLPPTIDPYPGGLVWIIRPVGIQCEETTSPGYGNLHEAVSTLTAAGVAVADSEMVELMVATSCGSPTSAHFRVQIAADDLSITQSMDWVME